MFTGFIACDGLGTAQTYGGQGHDTLDGAFLPGFTGVEVSTVAVASANFVGGTVTNGQVSQFQVVPEPSAAVLAIMAAATVAAGRRRRI